MGTWFGYPKWLLPICCLLLAACGGATPNSSTSSSGGSYTCPSSSSNAFNAFAQIIPGRIEAENFDPFEAARKDILVVNDYRPQTPIKVTAFASGYGIFTHTHYRTLDFTVQVQTAGEYEVFMRLGAPGLNRSLSIEQCGETLLADVAVPYANMVKGAMEYQTQIQIPNA